MSTVVWDGKTLAADCQATVGVARRKTSKMKQCADGTVLAGCGDKGGVYAMFAWFERDQENLQNYPANQSTERWARLIVVRPDGTSYYYEQPPAQIPLNEPFAFGSGMEFALGAMAMGATAVQAVKAAIKYDTGCGFGVESYTLGDLHGYYDDSPLAPAI